MALQEAFLICWGNGLKPNASQCDQEIPSKHGKNPLPALRSFIDLFSLSWLCMEEKWRNCKQGGVNRGNTGSYGYIQTGMKMFGMWLLCQVKSRRFDTSSESLGKQAGDLTIWHCAFFRGQGRGEGSKWTISAPLGPLYHWVRVYIACD